MRSNGYSEKTSCCGIFYSSQKEGESECKILHHNIVTELQLHSDQGFQYTSHAYFQLTKQHGITPSMSRKGSPYVNAMAENFFSIFKTKCIFLHKPATFSGTNGMLEHYMNVSS